MAGPHGILLFEGMGTALVPERKNNIIPHVTCHSPTLKTWPNLKLCNKVMLVNVCLIVFDGSSAW
jgi:hypothetical protein